MHEVVPIQDILCSGIGKIEHLDGGLVRIWLYVSQTPEDGGEPEKVVVAKIVGATGGIADALLKLAKAATPRSVCVAPIVDALMN